MVVMAVVMFTQVVLRFCFGNALTWAEESLRFMFIWLVFLGLPSGVYYSDFIRFDMLKTKLTGIPKKLLETAIFLVIDVIVFIMFWGAFTLISRQFSQQATTIHIPMGVIYMIMPISGILAIAFSVVKLILMWKEGSDFVAGGN
jgi:TRAP-type C4-dicarboxylate transport system permease small subunit